MSFKLFYINKRYNNSITTLTIVSHTIWTPFIPNTTQGENALNSSSPALFSRNKTTPRPDTALKPSHSSRVTRLRNKGQDETSHAEFTFRENTFVRQGSRRAGEAAPEECAGQSIFVTNSSAFWKPRADEYSFQPLCCFGRSFAREFSGKGFLGAVSERVVCLWRRQKS